ncbi:Bug family tripartite tricarboxylate transporter substrate binding protein [Lacisediminimonas profundi]|uniref:Bug family tripartite tricarboxylate transporter substrate binding protein n=1 Tax=Lacisediminimonas profundi TaxID=2603856 RepID=UPI00124B58A8|nr:tripartite tricarboxylate transporter substrate binding protein [Lacisediminimonas profundi]
MKILPRLIASLLLAATASTTALAQSSPAAADAPFPSRTIRIINPFSAGGPTDILARIVGAELSTRWGQPVIVESKPGAGGGLGMEAAARSPADGYTLVVAPTGPLVINRHIFSNLRYDSARDFAPVSLMTSIDNVLVVHPAVPAKDLKELISYAKANPGKLSYGSAGVGQQPHLAGEQLKLATGTDILHIPYKGTSEAVTAVLGGQANMMFGQVSAVAPLLQSGKVRAIGIASNKRSPVIPTIPTLQEQGLTGFESASIYALLAPKGTPAPVVEKLSAEIRSILQSPAIRKKVSDMGMDVVASSAEQLAELMRTESARYEKIIKDGKIKAE